MRTFGNVTLLDTPDEIRSAFRSALRARDHWVLAAGPDRVPALLLVVGSVAAVAPVRVAGVESGTSPTGPATRFVLAAVPKSALPPRDLAHLILATGTVIPPGTDLARQDVIGLCRGEAQVGEAYALLAALHEGRTRTPGEVAATN